MYDRVLVLSPHTDDAELGAGGTIAKFLEEGKEIHWIVYSTAEDSLPEGLPPDTLKTEFEKVISDFNIKNNNVTIFNYKVRHLSTYRQEILEHLVKVRSEINPDLVIGPSINDVHQDHQVISMEMIRAFKNSSSIICYELPWNNTKFVTNLFVELEEAHLSKKINVLKNYISQIKLNRPYFTSDFVESLAKVRGLQCNNDFAEAFEVIRWRI